MSTKVQIDWYIKEMLNQALDSFEGGILENPDSAIEDAIEFRGLNPSGAAADVAERLRAIDATRKNIESGDFSAVDVIHRLMQIVVAQTGRMIVEDGFVDLQGAENRLVLAGRVAMVKAILNAREEQGGEEYA